MARQAFAAVVHPLVEGGDQFGIGLAEENEPGYWPQVGFGSFPTFDAAMVKAHELNGQLGLTEEQAMAIIASSMRKRK